ncbi:MAG: Gfo/Idh/MocA family oxidoreductase [Acidobacteriota bacterium]
MRVAIIGLGSAGLGLHLPALTGLPSATVVGGCDLDARCRDRAARRWKIPTFSEPDEMLARTDPEVVIVATPPPSHAAHCLRALAAGAHVICEKPFVASLDEADQVIAAAAAAHRQVAVNHEFREMPIFRALIDQIGGSGAGSLRFVQAWQLMNRPPWAEAGWRGQMSERTLFEAGVHLVDLIIALFGEMPVSVQASMSGGPQHGSTRDAIVLATLFFSGNRLAHITQNRLCQGSAQYFEVRADTEGASFRASFGGRARLSAGLVRSKMPHLRFEYGSAGLAWREDGERRTALARNPGNPNMVATREVLKNAFAAFATNTPPHSSAAQARDVLEVVAGCYVSATEGERIRLGPAAPPHLKSFRMGG